MRAVLVGALPSYPPGFWRLKPYVPRSLSLEANSCVFIGGSGGRRGGGGGVLCRSLRVVAAPGPLRGPVGRRVADVAAAVTRRRTATPRRRIDAARRRRARGVFERVLHGEAILPGIKGVVAHAPAEVLVDARADVRAARWTLATHQTNYLGLLSIKLQSLRDEHAPFELRVRCACVETARVSARHTEQDTSVI